MFDLKHALPMVGYNQVVNDTHIGCNKMINQKNHSVLQANAEYCNNNKSM